MSELTTAIEKLESRAAIQESHRNAYRAMLETIFVVEAELAANALAYRQHPDFTTLRTAIEAARKNCRIIEA